MGGYGSNRWGGERTRLDTAGLLYLDIRALRRQGALQPGASSNQHWTRGRDRIPAGTISVRVDSHCQSATLIYEVMLAGQAPRQVRDRINLATTPCNFGGERARFICPGCLTNRDVLFCVGGVFRCRQCHNLAYASTREDNMDRSTRRVRKLQEKLGYLHGDPWLIPPRPEGMSYRKYWRLVDQLCEEIECLPGASAC